MTSDEIIKALIHCSVDDGCQGCPLKNNSGCFCVTELAKQALDLIDHQKAEINKLNKKVEELSEVLSDSIKIKAKEIKSEAIKEFGKFLIDKSIDKSENGIIQISDIPEYVKDMVGEVL